MFEVLEAKIIIFAENKQAEKKFLLKESFIVQQRKKM